MIPVFAPLAGVFLAFYFAWKFIRWAVGALRYAGREIAAGYREERSKAR